jgi:hypothetical protein
MGSGESQVGKIRDLRTGCHESHNTCRFHIAVPSQNISSLPPTPCSGSLFQVLYAFTIRSMVSVLAFANPLRRKQVQSLPGIPKKDRQENRQEPSRNALRSWQAFELLTTPFSFRRAHLWLAVAINPDGSLQGPVS